MRRALVLGGSGHVGGAIVRALRARGAEVCFTFRTGEARAAAVEGATGARALRVDLRDGAALTATVAEAAPTVLVHAAGVWAEGPAGWSESQAVGPGAALIACEAMVEAWERAGGGEVILIGALDRAQSLPLPPAFAAAQGALGALAMALGHALGPRGVRVNLAAVGLLDGGMATRLTTDQRDAFLRFSALRRAGTADEVAAVVAWLALENTYMNGRVLAVNGGI